ncbi:MAG: acyltransferase [Alphaproteobacteria bacterium]
MFYKFASSKALKVTGPAAQFKQPVLLEGYGQVNLADNVTFGVKRSPYFYNGYTYMEARSEQARIEIARNVVFNNSCVVISVKDGIHVGEGTVFGSKCTVIDSDFHALTPDAAVRGAPIKIGNNVFVGSNVTILKGVEIADNCVIANGAVVTKSFEIPCVIAGNPAQKVRDLDPV